MSPPSNLQSSLQPSVQLVVNPAARRGLAARRVEDVLALFEREQVPVVYNESRLPGDIEAQVEALAREGAMRIVVAGGDGTVHEAVNGLMRAGSEAALGLIPIGSGNDFSKAVYTEPGTERLRDRDWADAARALVRRLADNTPPRRIDLGRCNGRYFANGAGVGFDAMITRLSREVRLPVGNLVYVFGLVRALLQGVATPALRLEAGNYRYEGRATLANIANGCWLGGQFLIAPDAVPDDGQLNLVLAKAVTRRRILALVPRLKKGLHLEAEEVQHEPVDKLVIECEQALPLHLDGEVCTPSKRFEIDCVPGALPLL